MSVLFFVILFLHITTMFMAVAVSYGGVLFLIIALRARNWSGVTAMTATAKVTERLIPILYVAGGLFGLTAAIVNGYNLFAPWLLIAYGLFVLLTIFGAAFTGPTIQRIGAAVAAAPDGNLPVDTSAMASRFYRVEVLDFALLFLFIFDMVYKPFS